MRVYTSFSIGLAVMTSTTAAGAQAPPTDSSSPVEPPPPAAPAPLTAPYAAPFALRNMSATTALRAETAYGWNAGTSSTVVEYLTASYAPMRKLSVAARAGWVDYLPDKGSASTAFTNACVTAAWADRLSDDVRVAAAAGVSLPVGQGGGDAPDAGQAAAIAAGNLARSRFESLLMFKVDDLATFVGGDIAWVAHGLTLQAEATLFEGVRVRGGAPADPDSDITATTAGVHAGYAFVPELSLSIELRDQSFLSTPAAVSSGKTSRSLVSVGGGPRANLRIARDIWFRPALAYFQPLNDPTSGVSAANYHIFVLDLPVVF